MIATRKKNGKKFENPLKEVRRLMVKRAIGLPSPKNTPHSLQHKLQGMGDFPPLKMRKDLGLAETSQEPLFF